MVENGDMTASEHPRRSTLNLAENKRKSDISADKKEAKRRPHTFRTIVRLIAEDIRNGHYQPGDRLPTHRRLADKTGVAVATVSRAYEELSRIGLTSGEVGRGTFVRRAPGPRPTDSIRAPQQPSEIDLSINQPAISDMHDVAFKDALARLSDPAAGALRRDLAGYQPSIGRFEHRQAGAKWLGAFGFHVDPELIVLSSGIQQGVMISVAAAFRPGDVVIVENLTNPSFRSLASLFRLTLIGAPMDKDGIIPDALERITRETGAKGLYTIPSFQNPTGTVMPSERRAQIVEIAVRHNLVVIENAAYDAFLTSPLPSLYADLTARGASAFYISALTKVVMAGVRIAFVVPPAAMLSQVAGAVFATTTLVPPLAAEIASQWIMDGTAQKLADWQRQEARARHQIVKDGLGDLISPDTKPCNHLWLHVPEPWRADEILSLCRAQGLILSPPEAFVVGRSQAPQAIRLSVGAAQDRDSLGFAVDVLSNVLNGAQILPTGFT